MKLKLKLKNKGVIAFDPDTKNHWSGDEVIESEVTPFVSRALGKGILVIVEDKK